MKPKAHFERSLNALTRSLSLPMVTILTLIASNVHSQETPRQSPAPVKAEMLQPATPPLTYDLEIKDGSLRSNRKKQDNAVVVEATLEAVIDQLREAHPDANFVITPGLGSIPVGDLKLHTSRLEDKLEAIRIASGSRFQWAEARRSNPETSGYSREGQDSKARKPLYVIEGVTPPGKPRLQLEAFNITDYLDSRFANENKDIREKLHRNQVEVIRAVIEESMAVYRHADEASGLPQGHGLAMPRLQFHSGANLIIVIGEPEAVAIASKVLSAMGGIRRSSVPYPEDGLYRAPRPDEPANLRRPKSEGDWAPGGLRRPGLYNPEETGDRPTKSPAVPDSKRPELEGNRPPSPR